MTVPRNRRSILPPAALAAGGIGIVALVATLLLGVAIPAGPSEFDRTISAAVLRAYPAGAITLFDALGSLPVIVAVALCSAVVSWVRHQPRLALAFAVGLLVEVPTAVIKAAIDRPRPPAGGLIEALGSMASYPSGHTVRAVVFAGLVAVTIVRARGMVAGRRDEAGASAPASLHCRPSGPKRHPAAWARSSSACATAHASIGTMISWCPVSS